MLTCTADRLSVYHWWDVYHRLGTADIKGNPAVPKYINGPH